MRLRHSTLRRLNEALAALYDRGLSGGPWQGIAAWADELIGGSITCASVFTPECGYLGTFTDRFLEGRLAVDVPAETWAVHPMLRQRTGTVKALSDVLTSAQWHRNGVYQAMRDLVRYEDEMGMDLLLPDGRIFSLCVCREKRDFRDEERWLMELLMPHLKVILSHRPIVQTVQETGSKTERLTRRERDVLLWLKEGKTNSEIGSILGISPATVKRHLENLYGKLGVGNRISASRMLP